MGRLEPVRLEELRILDGPNLYFTRPAVKLTMSVGGWVDAPEARVAALAARLGLPGAAGDGGPRPRSGAPGTDHRRRVVARLAAHVTQALAARAGTHQAGPAPSRP